MNNDETDKSVITDKSLLQPQVFSPESINPASPLITDRVNVQSPARESQTQPPVEKREVRSTARKLAMIPLIIIDLLMTGLLIFGSILLIRTTGLFGGEQTPWLPGYSYLLSIPFLYIGTWRIYVGNVWNGISLLISPLLLCGTTIWYYESERLFDDIVWMIILGFILYWLLLLFKKTRYAFLLIWPVIVSSLIYRVYPDVVEASSQIPIIIMAISAIPAFIFVLLKSNILSRWRLSTAISILFFAVMYAFLSSTNSYTSNLPTSSQSDKVVALKTKAITETKVDGIVFQQIAHGHDLTYLTRTLSSPQPVSGGLVVPFKQAGSECDNWVALNPETDQILWAIYDEDKEVYCSQIESVKTSAADDVVVYYTLRELFIKKYSTGETLYQEDITVDANILIEKGVVYFTGMKNNSTGEPVFVKAFDVKRKKLSWETNFPGTVYSPFTTEGEDFFTLIEQGILSEVMEIESRQKRQFLFDRTNGNITAYEQLNKVRFDPPTTGFYLTPNDLKNNIRVHRNGVLSSPISKLNIKNKEVVLPEACRTLPVTFNKSVTCITDNYILTFRP